MNRVGANFRDEKAAQDWAKSKAKVNSKIEKVEGGYRVTWDLKPLKGDKP